MESGGYGKKGLRRLRLEDANQAEWDKFGEIVQDEVQKELATRRENPYEETTERGMGGRARRHTDRDGDGHH